jgi:hypothetical protein
MRTLILALGLGVLLVGRSAQADDRCTWNGTFYAEGSMSCQSGAQARCAGGGWKLTGSRCADEAGDPAGEENQPGVREPAVVQPPVR